MPKIVESLEESAQIKESDANAPRNLDAETKRPKLITNVVPSSYHEPHEEKDYKRKVSKPVEIMSHDILIPYMRNALIDPTEPRKSSFIPSSRMMYYVIHHMDQIIAQNHTFVQSQTYWHPYISRIYYGILFTIQVAKCMRHANSLSMKDMIFLANFESSYPEETLTIAGPLIPLFKSLCCSGTQYANVGIVYPRLPTSNYLHPRLENGKPAPQVSSWLIPNIPELIGLVDRITGEAARIAMSTNNWKRPYNPHKEYLAPGVGEGVQPVINGYNWHTRLAPRRSQRRHDRTDFTTAPHASTMLHQTDESIITSPEEPDPPMPGSTETEEEEALFNWYFATPGLVYEPECMKDSEEKFVSYGYRLGLPKFTASSRFGTLEKFLGMTDCSWFAEVSSTMSHYARFFKGSGNMGQCAVRAAPASQVIIDYIEGDKPLVPPNYPGDPMFKETFTFRGHTQNMLLNQDEALHGFFSQLNVLGWEGHPFLGRVSTVASSYMKGPFWSSSEFEKESITDSNYLQIPEVIRSKFALDKPKT